MERWRSKTLGGSPERRARSHKSAVSLADALEEFGRFLEHERQAAAHTITAYRADLARFAADLEGNGHSLRLVDVTSEDVREHMHELIDRRLSRATVRRALYALGSFFRWALRWELIDRNPVDRIVIPRRQRLRIVRALSKRERAVIVAAADRLAKVSRRSSNRQAPLLIRLMLKTGLRRSEVLALRWADIDLEIGEVFVRQGKGDKSRRVPIEDRDLLDMLRAVQRLDSTVPVFIGSRCRPLGLKSFYRLFHRILEVAELRGQGITPHSLRHTFGTVLCARGVPVPYVKDLLGHEDIGTTMVYVHTTPTALRQAVRKLAE